MKDKGAKLMADLIRANTSIQTLDLESEMNMTMTG